MRYSDLFEDENNIDVEYYLTEGCGIFAYILSKLLTNSKIIILSDKHGEKWNNKINYEVTHVAILNNGNLYDIRGKRTINDMISQDFSQGLEKREVVSPEEFKKHYMDGTDNTPLYAPDANDIRIVGDYIRNNSKLFDLSLKENSTAGSTSSGNVATSIGELGAGFAPDQDWRSIYPKKKHKTLVIKR